MLETFLDRGVGDTHPKRPAGKEVPRQVRGEVLLDARLDCKLL